MAFFEPLFDALEASGARYVVVGGLATVLHGFARLTADVDLVVDLEPDEARKVLAALQAMGLRPRAPVGPYDFADPLTRKSWTDEKGMKVFSLWDPSEPLREVDLFVEHLLPFDGLFARSELVELGASRVRIASIPDLIALKRLAGRPQDLQDIEALEAILESKGR
jgi:hypothetical protein